MTSTWRWTPWRLVAWWRSSIADAHCDDYLAAWWDEQLRPAHFTRGRPVHGGHECRIPALIVWGTTAGSGRDRPVWERPGDGARSLLDLSPSSGVRSE